LSYTQIKAPIYGVIGKTEAREGEFVGKDPNPVILNTVSRIDTMRVQFFLTEAEYLSISRDVLKRTKEEINEENADEKAYQRSRAYNLELLLSDGSLYGEKGQVDFVNRNVDPTTGSMLVQAHFPNPKRLLRPGLYAKVRAQMQIVKDGLLIPSRCISELQGQYSVMLLTDSNTIVQRKIIINAHIGDYALVSDGLNEMDHVVLEGIQKVGTGTKINPVVVEFESKTNPE
jgi:membrane fusion protein (multidrug efflux system)